MPPTPFAKFRAGISRRELRGAGGARGLAAWQLSRLLPARGFRMTNVGGRNFLLLTMATGPQSEFRPGR